MIQHHPHFSRTAALVPCLLQAIFHATARHFMPRASFRFSRSRSSNTSEHHCERLLFTPIMQSSETHVVNWKYSSTKHRYRCCGIRVGIRRPERMTAFERRGETD